MRDKNLSGSAGQQGRLQEFWKLDGFLCAFFSAPDQRTVVIFCIRCPVSDRSEGAGFVWCQGSCRWGMCSGAFFFFFLCQMKTNSSACWRASLFHRSYCSTRSDLLNLSKLFTYANRRNFDIMFLQSVPQFTKRKLWKRETRNQYFCVCVCVCSWKIKIMFLTFLRLWI